jgi:eukaryotic-like serine/threonine-protein kinase
VVCVHLALLSDMLKGRPWTPTELKRLGGAEGVGVTFLEDAFGAATAQPQHRFHQKAAKSVLSVLLPEHGGNLAETVRSHRELLEASGYEGRPKFFEELMQILDGELRLVTPTEGKLLDPKGCPPP